MAFNRCSEKLIIAEHFEYEVVDAFSQVIDICAWYNCNTYTISFPHVEINSKLFTAATYECSF